MTDMDDMLMDIDDLGAEESADVSMTDRDHPSLKGNSNDKEIIMDHYKYKDHTLDCYPYTFSPLLLFSTDGYFDRGYSNYNAVASFFDPVLRGVLGDVVDFDGGEIQKEGSSTSPRRGEKTPEKEQEQSGGGINMMEGVVYERKNMTYDDLYNYIVDTKSIVTCCIDAHFTAFQIINPKTLIYYDPMSPAIKVARGESDVQRVAVFLLLKCNYGDNVHIQENKSHYTGHTSSQLQRFVHSIWNKINTLSVGFLNTIRMANLPLDLNKYLFINGSRDTSSMSTQLTGNTCYFQTYLFVLLCKVGRPKLSSDGRCIELQNVEMLEQSTIAIARFLLTFFIDGENKVLRPLTNNNFLLDFYRYRDSAYYEAFTNYLKRQNVRTPNYHQQYTSVKSYFVFNKTLHGYDKFQLEGATSSTANTKSLQYVQSTDGASLKLARGDYYKYRAANLMFGCNAGAMYGIVNFSQFNSWRKNQLLSFDDVLQGQIGGIAEKIERSSISKYRDYYFMAQFEVGQQELVDIHHYTYLMDMCMMNKADKLADIVYTINKFLAQKIYFSMQGRNNYHKLMDLQDFVKARKYMNPFQQNFLTAEWFREYIGLGFSDINPKEKDINSLTQTVFYNIDMIRGQSYRQDYEFEKECINQMARSNIRRFGIFEEQQNTSCKYEAILSIGKGYTYSKYNTLMHFLSVVESYWSNPDVNNIQVFGKDIRTLLAISCQKIFFDPKHCGYYHYGSMELRATFREELDLAVASDPQSAIAQVSASKKKGYNYLNICDRVYEFSYMKRILDRLFRSANGQRIKSDNGVLNLLLLSLMLDFGLYNQYAKLLNIPFMKDLQHEADTKELQVEVSNLICDFDRKHVDNPITRSKVEAILFEVSYKFLINKGFPIQSNQFKLIQMLNSDSDYQEYVLLCKIYMSLCQINKSVEVDYYKIRCNGVFHIVIPQNFSKVTSEYLEHITTHHTFSENEGIMTYDNIHVFDLRPQQPEINLYRVRLQSGSSVESMVKYIEISNVFRAISSNEQYLVFIGDNSILIDVDGNAMSIRINQVKAEISTIMFNEAISFIPCFKYSEGGEDVILFTSKNIHYHVDKGGQFCSDYYGMKVELVECIISDELFVDLNDDIAFEKKKLSEIITESKVVLYFPDYLLLVSSRQQLINLLDYAIYIRNISFFILVLIYLRRTSVKLEFIERKDKIIQISGPWKAAILYVLGMSKNAHYDTIFSSQFSDLDQYKALPMRDFIDKLCDSFTRYQRFTEENQYQIIPTEKQKRFLEKIICGEECFHFSEVGSGKTKVILPLLCQAFLSSNKEAHRSFARCGNSKDTLVILVPEHLVNDARTQVFRHCLNINFKQEYRVYDDIFALLHKNVALGDGMRGPSTMKQIFVTSFNQFKKALTYDKICKKLRPHRERILVIADEVDDFLDRDKLVFNICSNAANAFNSQTLEFFHETSKTVYHGSAFDRTAFASSPNPDYWRDLHEKFVAINSEIQDASKSLNKSFGIFNEKTLRHCTTSISHDIEGYKALIARPYESVNRAMPGSYYSDVERTIYLTFVILSEDISKYNDLFQGERKFITFEYWKENLRELDYDELVYGHDRLSEIAEKHPRCTSGIIRFLYIIILKRMEIRDGSRSVNSVDIMFNFDIIGFTGTPFLDNYPTADYIRNHREDDIPPVIDRSFYAYTSEDISAETFQERFSIFQGTNKNVNVEFVSSNFMQETLKLGEMETLQAIFEREQRGSTTTPPFNVAVDLCGVFKLTTIYDVRALILKHFGPDCFHYIYHIDQIDGSDRMLCIRTNNDVAFDEEFYKHLCRTYGSSLSSKVFFFVDNRNYIGKDVPYQLGYQRQFQLPLFTKSVVIAHDVSDFSKIWQAMGRSRTMNSTSFSIYKNDIPVNMVSATNGPSDIKNHPLTQYLYTRNCDCKMAGNLSSIYQTVIALYNLSEESFYYRDEIVNTFIEKMDKSIGAKIEHIEEKISKTISRDPASARILQHILIDKFRRSPNKIVAKSNLTSSMSDMLSRHIVRQKFEQRNPSKDIFDDYILFLSGEQVSLMEISYTKQQQKQKQKQKTKSQDNDTMDEFNPRNQLNLTFKVDDYFKATIRADEDNAKKALSLPLSIPIFKMFYWDRITGKKKAINVYPTLQFLMSHHIKPAYIDDEVRKLVSRSINDLYQASLDFLATVVAGEEVVNDGIDINEFHSEVKFSCIRQHPHYCLVGIQPGVYLIGMKDQFNIFDCVTHPLKTYFQYTIDDIGFVLFDKTRSKSVDEFGPYFIENYLILDALSKPEVAQNVITYYSKRKESLTRCLKNYDEKQGKGFICWRFFMNQAHD